jgi:23S rRNA G2445 N2-methylase RlmL
MLSFKAKSRIIVTCSKRLSPYLEKEIADLGFKIVRTFQTGVELNGSLTDCIKLNLNLRCASQVLFSFRSFQARDPKQLYDVLVKLRWEDVIPDDGYFTITSNVNTASVNTELFANVKVKDAIVDRFREVTGNRPNSGSEQDKTVVHLYWQADQVEVFIDTSGETLSKHGYRKIPGKAPLLESLASALVYAGKWNRSTPFVNPMCGSGTLAIEAACLATNRVPGLYRSNYAFMHLKGYDPEQYKSERQKIENGISDLAGTKIIATDISEDAINISRINAGIAGVQDLIDFRVCDFEDTPVPEQSNGVVYFNPEYGERLGDEMQLQETYSRVGDFLKKKCRGYIGYVFTGNLQLAKKIGLKADRKLEFYTSKIDCRLLEYELYEGSRRS